jgi:hypothetical protein
MQKFSGIQAARLPRRRDTLIGLAAAALTGASSLAAAPALPPGRRLTVIDETTGLALGGYDPVAYFVDGAPRLGDARLQLDWHGAGWTFVHEGNLGAFRDRPEVYAPVFGGYCAYAVSGGYPGEGSPFHFQIIHDRLYLFASAVNRLAFLEGGEAILARAAERWPDVARDLP